MSNKAFGIVTSAANYVKVEGLHAYRPIGAFSFLGRYRIVDFPISNLSNSGIDRIQVYVGSNPRSMVEHLEERYYNINSKRGSLQVLFNPESINDSSIYNTDINGYLESIDIIERMTEPYVVITPSYMVYRQDFNKLVDDHIASGADITLLYHRVDNAKELYGNCDVLNLNRQKGVLSIERNPGNVDARNIFMDTYVMKKDLFVELIKAAKAESSMYRLANIVSIKAEELDVRGVQHKGYFAAITDLKSYFDANLELLDRSKAEDLISEDWPIYTQTTDSCPTQYFNGAKVKNSMISNGCTIEGVVENSIIGRGVHIGKDAVVKNCVVLAYSDICGKVTIENYVVDKWAKLTHSKDIIAPADKPGYIRKSDII